MATRPSTSFVHPPSCRVTSIAASRRWFPSWIRRCRNGLPRSSTSSSRTTCLPGGATPSQPGRSSRPLTASTRSRSSSSWPKHARRRPMATDPHRMLEREVKLAVPPVFALPDLEDLAAAVKATPIDEQRLETVYYDTPDLRLARWGANLRIRQGEGWTLKLPSTGDGQVLTRPELQFARDGGQPPDAAAAPVIAHGRRATLVPRAS